MNDLKLNEPETYSRTTARGVLKFIQTKKVDRRDIQKLKFKELEELLLPSKDSKKTPVTMSDKPKVNDGNSLTPQKNNITNSPASPANTHLMPSPIITRRTRTVSTSDRAMRNPLITGMVKSFSRSKGHGFITPSDGSPEIFVHISDIEGEYIPQSGDEVSYRICSIPPKFEKYQAIHVQITNLTPNVHTKWETPSYD